MLQPAQSSRIRASKDGLQKLKNARESKRTDDGKRWSYEYIALKLSEKSYHVSKDTVERFLTGKRVYRDNASAICEFLGSSLEEVIELVTSKSKKSTDIDWQEVCFTMLEPKRELASNLFTSGMGITFKLDDIQVPLGLIKRSEKVQHQKDVSPDKGSQVYREVKEKEKITPIEYKDFCQQVLANQKSPKNNGKHLTIIGEPGAGKTTQLLKIADWVLDETENLPIWISLGVVGEKPLQEYLLKDWLRDAAGKLDAAPPEWVEQLEQHLKDGRVWLLLDGADEMQVADPLGKLAEFLRVPLLKNVRVVLTCRLNLWDAAGNALSKFDTYKMLDFSYGDGNNPDQVKQFIDKWFGNPSLVLSYKEREQEASPHVGETEGGQQLRKALDETGKERIKDLARHPLRLALLCFTWQSGREKLPDTKAELYEMFVEALYVLKKGVFPTTSAQQIDLNAALGQLALKALDKGFKSILPHSLVYEELEKPYPELFELANKLGWLNRVGDEPENPLKSVYAFFHPTFQEYFAACAISHWDFFLPCDHIAQPVENRDNPEEYNKRYRIFDSHWKEVFLLWLGCKKKKSSMQNKLIERLMNFDDGCNKFYWYRAYFLAASGLAELKSCNLADEIVTQLIKWGFGYFDDEQQKWIRFPEPIAIGARSVWLQTECESAIKELINLIHNGLDENICQQAAKNRCEGIDLHNRAAIDAVNNFERTLEMAAIGLGYIGNGYPDAVTALIDLLSNPHHLFTIQEAAESLVKIGNSNLITITALNNLLDATKDWYIHQQEVESRNPDAISWYWYAPLLAAWCLGKIDSDKSAAIATLSDLLHRSHNDYIRKEAARCLGEIDPDKSAAIKVLIELLCTSPTPQYAAYSLAKIGIGNEETITAMIDLLCHSDDRSTRYYAAEILSRIAIGNSQAITVLTELLNPNQDEFNRWLVANSLGQIDPSNPKAIAALTELLDNRHSEDDRLWAAESLCKIAPATLEAIDTLIDLLHNYQDGNIPILAIERLGQFGTGNSKATSALIDLVYDSSRDEFTRRESARSLGQIRKDDPDITAALIHLMHTSEHEFTWEAVAYSLMQINDPHLLEKVFVSLKDYLVNPLHHSAYSRYKCCYQVIWHCAQNMSYPDFYEVWHRQSTTTHPEAPDNIPVGNSAEAQILEAQNIDFNQLQPTEHTYPLAINLLSLKEEREQEAIAQKLCTKIYKHHAVKIPGKPPTVKSDAELQQHLFEIQDKLQRPNLALVLYIKDTNGFHEPTEEAIAFCQKLADPDLGIHIAWITNQSLEQPLKPIQPDPPKLISKIQSWIDEIV